MNKIVLVTLLAVPVALLMLASTSVAAGDGVKVEVLNANKAAKEATKMKLERPPPREDGRINTNNHRGGMTAEVEPIDEEFHNYLHTLPTANSLKVLEVGPAWGKNCLNTLQNIELAAKIKRYVLCDLDEQHLMVIAKDVFKSHPNQLEKLREIRCYILSEHDPLPRHCQLNGGRFQGLLRPAQARRTPLHNRYYALCKMAEGRGG